MLRQAEHGVETMIKRVWNPLTGSAGWKTAGHVAALAAVVALAAYLRLGNLTDNPGWFADEGSNLEVARSLGRGQIQYMALGQSTLLVSRLVVFENILAEALKLFGGGIGTLRSLTGLMGVASVLALYLCARRMTGKAGLALLSALLLAIYPQAVLYSRFGFSYNLLGPLVLAATLGLWEYSQSARRAWLALAALSIGLGAISDLWMLAMAAPFALSVLIRRWRDLAWSLPLAACPFGVYLVLMWAYAPQALWVDLNFVLFRVSNVSILGQMTNVALNYTVLLSQDFWMPCAIAGFIVLRPAPLGCLMLGLFFLLIIALGRTIALHGLSAHYMIPLLPLVAFGTAALVDTGIPFLWRTIDEALRSIPVRLARVASTAACVLIVGVPFLVSLGLDLDHVQNGFPTAIDPFLTNPAEARQAADFINAHTGPQDLVIVSPSVSWLINARTADVQMSIAAGGTATAHYPANLPAERWVFDPRVDGARYVVIDNFWRGWGIANIAGLGELTDRVEQWPVVFRAGSMTVYGNPAGR